MLDGMDIPPNVVKVPLGLVIVMVVMMSYAMEYVRLPGLRRISQVPYNAILPAQIHATALPRRTRLNFRQAAAKCGGPRQRCHSNPRIYS